MEYKITVLIIGAGPAGLATSACLNVDEIPNIVLEKEDCCASLWKKKTYDRMKLHISKEFCKLPHKPFPRDAPTFVPKNDFVRYLDDYASTLQVNPFYCRIVRSATFDVSCQDWVVVAQNSCSGAEEIYRASFLVVATGENNEPFIPPIPGLDSFPGITMHSSHYRNGVSLSMRDVLVVGSGNSGMEISYDLANWGANTSLAFGSPLHILTKEMVQLGMYMLKVFSVNVVDKIVLMLSKLWFGNLGKYGIKIPEIGPFLNKNLTGRSPIIDVGTIWKIKKGEIKVFSRVKEIHGQSVEFVNGIRKEFDAIVFATGYCSTVRKWLKDEARLFNTAGMPKNKKPDHWKGEDGLYCAGFSSSGLLGISNDAVKIAQDISNNLKR